MWYKYEMGYFYIIVIIYIIKMDLKNQHWNYEIRPTVPTGMDLGGKYSKRNQQQGKRIADVMEGEIEKKIEEAFTT